MTNHPELLKLAFDWYVASYYLTKRQRQAGRRISLGKVVCIHYETSWEGQSRKSDNFFVMGEEPETVVESIKRYGPAEDHRLYVIADRPSLTISYMGLDCSAMTPAGTLMARNLENLPMTTNDLELFRPESPGDVLMLNTIEGADLTLAEDVVDPNSVDDVEYPE